MNRKHQDPFIILKNQDFPRQFTLQPKLKLRKPTKHSWTSLQSFYYVSFLKENLEAMESTEYRKNLKVFSLMAKRIKTRNSTQVKSHHQKLQRKFGKISTIISKVSQLLSGQYFPMKKDAETCIELKIQHQEQSQGQNYYNATQEVLENVERRSQVRQIFFEQESDIYLIFEGNHRYDEEQPLI